MRLQFTEIWLAWHNKKFTIQFRGSAHPLVLQDLGFSEKKRAGTHPLNKDII